VTPPPNPRRRIALGARQRLSPIATLRDISGIIRFALYEF